MEYKCLRPNCQHVWQARVNNPQVCPRCKSYLWREKQRESTQEGDANGNNSGIKE